METTALSLRKTLSWRTLLKLAALANLAVLLFMGLVQRDTLALGLGAVTLVGLALLRVWRGLPGAVLLGLLFADITVWTVSGAVNNLMYGERGLALLLPSLLGVFSLTGLAACVGVVINRRTPQAGSRAALLVGGIGLGLLVGVTALSLLPGAALAQSTPATEIVLGSKSMLYTTTELDAEPGEVTVSLWNDDLWWHTFTIDELGIDLYVPMGAERSVTFNAPPGVYRFYCGIPGHEALGMAGTLNVGK